MKDNKDYQVSEGLFDNETKNYAILENDEWISSNQSCDLYGYYSVFEHDSKKNDDFLIAYTKIYGNQEKLKIDEIILENGMLVVATKQYECILQSTNDQIIGVIASELEKKMNNE